MKRNAIVVGVVALLMMRCTTHVSIGQVSHAVVEHEPTEGAVHSYPGLSPLQSVRGPFVAVFFTAPADLENIAARRSHHLYFRVVPCSQATPGDELAAGSVFAATADEQSRLLGASHAGKESLYKVYVPLDLKTIPERASVRGSLDEREDAQTARNDNLCIRLGGGQMWGTSLVSNLLPVPLVTRDGSLRSVDEERSPASDVLGVTVEVKGPLVIGFFPPFTKSEEEMDDGGISEGLAHVSYALEDIAKCYDNESATYRLDVTRFITLLDGERVRTIRIPRDWKRSVGLLFVAPGQEPKIVYATAGPSSLIYLGPPAAAEYFDAPACRVEE